VGNGRDTDNTKSELPYSIGQGRIAVSQFAKAYTGKIGRLAASVAWLWLTADTAGAQSIDQSPPISVPCHNEGDVITVQGIASASSPESADGSTRSIWALNIDQPICLTDSSKGASGHQTTVSRLQIMGQAPPSGVEIELTGKLVTGHLDEDFAEHAALKIIKGHRIASAPPTQITPQNVQDNKSSPADQQLSADLISCDQQAAQQSAYATAPRQVSPGAIFSPPLLLNQLAAKKQWDEDQPRRLAAIEQQRQACQERANVASDQRQSAAQHLRDQQEATAQHFQTEQQRGYKRITFEDFQLDGKQLAATESKVALTGAYVKVGESEYLFPSTLSVATMRESFNLNAGIGLLTDDAPRNIRKFFLDCQNNPAASQLGCPLNVLGYATMCTRTNLIGTSQLPCLVVDDGW
jgi:hypothetical protein